MVAHTPGPWLLDEAGIVAVGEDTDWGLVAMVTIPECYRHLDDDDVPAPIDAELQANARLIAAAPDLLAALVACQELFGKALPQFDWGRSALSGDAIRILNETPGQVRRALAKAEGRQ